MELTDLPLRLQEKIVPNDDGCWLWTAAHNSAGYGRVWDIKAKRMMPAQRLTYQLLVGPIPDGLDLDHLCRQHACVNPAHLEPVTRSVNMLRGENIGRPPGS